MTTTTGAPAKRAAIYIRVSSAGQEQDGTSLETQEAACRAYAAENGYTVLAVYSDTWSGFDWRDRPQMNALRAAVRHGELDAIVCYAVDRLSRHQTGLAILMDEFQHAGVAVEFVTEKFEDNAVGRFILSARGFAAEIEREKITERTLRGRRASATAGKPVQGPGPSFGFMWADATKSRLVLEPDTAPIARRMFGAIAGGTSLYLLAEELTAQGVPTPHGGGGGVAWDASSLSRMLKNPLYVGRAYAFRSQAEKRPCTKEPGRCRYAPDGQPHAHRRIVTRPPEEWITMPAGAVEPLVDEATFAAVQERLRLNVLRAPRRLSDPENYLLRGGIARCATCGEALAVRKPPRQQPQYYCGGGSRTGRHCPSGAIRTADLDGAVWPYVTELLTNPRLVEQVLTEQAAADGAAQERTTRDAIRRQLADVQRKQGNIAQSIAALDGEEEAAAPLHVLLRELAAKRRSLEQEQERIEAQATARRQARERLTRVQEWLGTIAARLDHATYEQKRLALDALGARVLLHRAEHTPRWELHLSVPVPAHEHADAAAIGLRSCCGTPACS